jgi:hypothetical protein
MEENKENDVNVTINDNDDASLNDNVKDEDTIEEKKGFKLPENMNFKGILIWGVVGFGLAIILVFIVSLIAGTLPFILGRLFLFGIIFFIVGAGIRLLLEIFSPGIFKSEDSENQSKIENISNESSTMGGNIDTSIDDKIDTDPLWTSEKKEEEPAQKTNTTKIREKFGKDSDYVKVEGTDIVFPNNAELMAEATRTMMAKDEDD